MQTSALPRPAISRLIAVALMVLAASFPRAARADAIAPELETADLRARASYELRRLVAALPESEQRHMVGAYVAFDPSASDPNAQIACDDDGDYVVLVSDAMLRLTSHVSRALSYEAAGKQKVEAYASFVAHARVPGRRLTPPPLGFHAGTSETFEAAYEGHLSDAIAFILARELGHFRGRLTCPAPTPTRERGDAVWTDAERAAAAALARKLYPSTIPDAARLDEEAVRHLARTGYGRLGGLAVLRFFAQLDIDLHADVTRPRMTYALLHPNAARSIVVVERSEPPADGGNAVSLGW